MTIDRADIPPLSQIRRPTLDAWAAAPVGTARMYLTVEDPWWGLKAEDWEQARELLCAEDDEDDWYEGGPDIYRLPDFLIWLSAARNEIETTPWLRRHAPAVDAILTDSEGGGTTAYDIDAAVETLFSTIRF